MTRKYSEAQNKATQKYIKNNYDTITVRVPKGMRDKYNAHAESKDTSLSKLIINLLNEDIKNTRVKTFEDGVEKAFKRGVYSEHNHKWGIL